MKEMAAYSSVLAWRTPGMGEPGASTLFGDLCDKLGSTQVQGR